MRIGILASHPIQYQAPWFRSLAHKLDLEVFFAHNPTPAQQSAGFGGAFEWDVDLLSGYSHRFLLNRSRQPSTSLFFGCDTPEIGSVILTEGFGAFVVSGWNLKTYWQAIRACRRVGVPVLVRGDSQLARSVPTFKRRAKQLTYPLMLRQFDGFLSVGIHNSEYLKYYGVPAAKIFFVPHFVDNSRFAIEAESIRGQRSEIRSEWGIPEDAFCVLFCGKFIPKKRPLDLVSATKSLLTDNRLPNVHLLFVGSGELGRDLRANCNVAYDAETPNNKQPITDNTKPAASFTGFLNQTQVSAAYVVADVLVLPSDRRETWGLVVNEAMACGLPAIVSDAVGCAPDLVEEGQTGFTFASGKAGSLAEKMAKLRRMHATGFDFHTRLAQKMRVYSVENAAEATMQALESVCRKRGESCNQ